MENPRILAQATDRLELPFPELERGAEANKFCVYWGDIGGGN